MKVFLTGVNGFLGAHLARRFAAAGHEVAGTSRDPGRLPDDLRGLDVTTWSLDRAMPVARLRGVDVIVHLAYEHGADGYDHNLHGTRTARDAARDAGVPRQVFVSSFSATPDATSAYGRLKHELERDFVGDGMTIVRPGLVVGPGGLFARMVDNVRRLPVVPLPAGGRRAVPIIGLDDLTDRILRIATAAEPPATANLCYAERPPLRALLQAIARALGRRRLWMTIPIGLLLVPVQLLGLIGLRFGVSPESLKAYRSNSEDQHVSDCETFGLPERSLDEVVARAVNPNASTT